MRKHIPNLITSLNLAAGFISIIFTFGGYPALASWLILAAMAFDFLDGLSARLLKAYSVIGKELDSLADIVSFGVAPAVLIYQLLGDSLEISGPILSGSVSASSLLILLVPVIMPVCAALRLAIFNTDETQATSFRGLPTPANALAVISVTLAFHYGDSRIISAFAASALSLVFFTIIVSLLMVTRIPLISLKTSHLRFRGNEARYILAVLVILSLSVFGIEGAVLIIPLYLAASLASPLFR